MKKFNDTNDILFPKTNNIPKSIELSFSCEYFSFDIEFIIGGVQSANKSFEINIR